MSLAILASRALDGMDALAVRVEVHVGPGLPSFHVVGLPDAGVRESRERVRSAIVSSGFAFPDGRITVNLAPADLPKESGRFDLPIALGVLLASGQTCVCAALQPQLPHYVFAGELSLTGAIMPVLAPLAIALGVAKASPQAVLVLPFEGARHAAHVPKLTVLGARSLREVASHLAGGEELKPIKPVLGDDSASSAFCMSDVRGQSMARRALEIAASGQHSLLMSGSPGTGKSMLAHRLPSLLPMLDTQQYLEVAAMAGLCRVSEVVNRCPPFRAPHHSASVAALVGGGSYPRPGEISRAHHGVLFLDELPEFQRAVIESLREPLETGYISIARSARVSRFPAAFQLVAAMNPCPCGWATHSVRSCRCTPDRIERYQAKISGPFLDRVDLHITLPEAGGAWASAPPSEASCVIQERVVRCRQRQLQRQGRTNAGLSPAQIDRYCVLDPAGQRVVQQGVASWGWSLRVVHRILRVARTLADMAEQHCIQGDHLAEAIHYRQDSTL